MSPKSKKRNVVCKCPTCSNEHVRYMWWTGRKTLFGKYGFDVLFFNYCDVDLKNESSVVNKIKDFEIETKNNHLII